MEKRRLVLSYALLFSLGLHLLVVGGSEIALPELFVAPDEVVASQKPAHVQRVQIRTRPPAAKAVPAGWQRVRATARRPTTPPQARQHRRKPAATPARTLPMAIPAAPEPDSQNAVPPAEPVAEPALAPAPPPPPEPPPAFPVRISADLEAHFNNLPFTIHQEWAMEGYRYAISLDAKRFGFHFQASSEGQISPEGGLNPAHYRLLLNNKLRNFSDYAEGQIRYGKPTFPKSAPLPVVPQDTASLPFHLAVTFAGRPQTFFVSTGNSVYQIRLTATAEEKLKLPVGTLRTLHLVGERFDKNLGRMVTGYEVWLAPDYLNYPVKFIGHNSDGDRFEYRVKRLELEGKLVLGSGEEQEVAAPEEAIPEWLRQQTHAESLNIP